MKQKIAKFLISAGKGIFLKKTIDIMEFYDQAEIIENTVGLQISNDIKFVYHIVGIEAASSSVFFIKNILDLSSDFSSKVLSFLGLGCGLIIDETITSLSLVPAHQTLNVKVVNNLSIALGTACLVAGNYLNQVNNPLHKNTPRHANTIF